MKEAILTIIAIVLIFFMIARTTINGVFPYVHMEYPVRGVVVLILSGIVGWIGTLIKC